MSVTIAEHYGRGLYQSTGVNLVISRGNGKMRTIVATVGGLSVQIEPLTNWRYRPGHALFVVFNAGANSFTFKDPAGTTIVTIAAGKVAIVDCYSVAGTGSFGARIQTPV